MWVSVAGKSGRAYRGKLLNRPHNLTTVKQGEEILFLAGPKGIDPFRVTPKYLKEREHWHILPCNKCGMPELFDAPSDLIAVIFPACSSSRTNRWMRQSDGAAWCRRAFALAEQDRVELPQIQCENRSHSRVVALLRRIPKAARLRAGCEVAWVGCTGGC
jgi:hypothetical protein